MPAAIRFSINGGPEVLHLEDVPVGKPGPQEVQVRHTAIGVNYIDVYDRTGLYPVTLPSGLGREAAGVITALGRGVRGFRVGERVAYVYPSPGAYCEVRNVPAERLVKVPRGVSDEQAAALMLKGLTAHFLIRRTFRVKRGDTLLVHAAAGGVGLILCQWARALGAIVIGVVVGLSARDADARRVADSGVQPRMHVRRGDETMLAALRLLDLRRLLAVTAAHRCSDLIFLPVGGDSFNYRAADSSDGRWFVNVKPTPPFPRPRGGRAGLEADFRLCGRAAIHRIASSRRYFYTLRVLYEKRSPARTIEEPLAKMTQPPIERSVDRWGVELPPAKEFSDSQGDGVRLDAALTSGLFVRYQIKHGQPLRLLGDPVFFEASAVAIDKHSALDPTSLYHAVDRAIADMHSDGTLRRLSLQYYGTDASRRQ